MLGQKMNHDIYASTIADDVCYDLLSFFMNSGPKISAFFSCHMESKSECVASSSILSFFLRISSHRSENVVLTVIPCILSVFSNPSVKMSSPRINIVVLSIISCFLSCFLGPTKHNILFEKYLVSLHAIFSKTRAKIEFDQFFYESRVHRFHLFWLYIIEEYVCCKSFKTHLIRSVM